MPEPQESPEINPNDECDGEWRDRTYSAPLADPCANEQVLECSGCGTITVILHLSRTRSQCFEFPAGYNPAQAYEAAIREAWIISEYEGQEPQA